MQELSLNEVEMIAGGILCFAVPQAGELHFDGGF